MVDNLSEFPLKRFFFFICLWPLIANAENQNWGNIDWKTGKLSHLAQYIGTYQYEKILEDLYVDTELKKVMNEDDLRHLKQNFNVRGSIGMSGAEILLAGNDIHKGSSENSLLLVNIYNGEISALLRREGKFYLYSNAKNGKKYIQERIMDYIIVRERVNKCWKEIEENFFNNIEWRYYEND